MSDLTILALSNKIPTEPYLFYGAFLDSLNKFGYAPVIIDDSVGKYGGLGSRPRLCKAAIDQGLVKTKYVWFLDAWDIFVQQSPDVALDKFLSWHKSPKLVIGSEKNIFPFPWYGPLHPEAPTEYRYLNSGCIIGETQAFYDALVEMKCEEVLDDHRKADGTMHQPICQSAWQEQFINGTIPIALDYRCEIVQNYCMVPVDEMDFDGPLIQNRVTGGLPVALHANGPKDEEVTIRSLQKFGYR